MPKSNTDISLFTGLSFISRKHFGENILTVLHTNLVNKNAYAVLSIRFEPGDRHTQGPVRKQYKAPFGMLVSSAVLLSCCII